MIEFNRHPVAGTPAIGEYWKGQGGIYAGIMPDYAGTSPYHLSPMNFLVPSGTGPAPKTLLKTRGRQFQRDGTTAHVQVLRRPSSRGEANPCLMIAKGPKQI